MVQRKTQRLIQKIKSNKKTIIIFLYTVGSMLFLFSIYFDTLTGNPFDIGTKQRLRNLFSVNSSQKYP